MKNKTTIKQKFAAVKNQLFIKSPFDFIFAPSANNTSPEFGQAITRIGISFVALLTILAIGYFSSIGSADRSLAISIVFSYLVFSITYCFLIYQHPERMLWRKYFIIFSDILVVSFAMNLFGVAGAAMYPLYMWIVIGNGLSFGLRFLHYSSAIAISGFSLAVLKSDAWLAQIELAIGLGLAMMIMPLFFLTLLRHLNHTNQLLEHKIKETEYMVAHDTLTRLPNRLFLEQKLLQAIQESHGNKHQLAVFFIDVNSFKFINDTLGHLAGDQLIIQFSKRLANCLRASDLLARLSGDEFMMLLDNKQAHSYAAKVAERLMDNANGHYELSGHEIYVSFSVGIALYPQDGEDVESLIKNSDTALFYAKKHSKSSYRFYDKKMSAEVSDELMVQTELRKALENQEFELYYQAQVDSQTQAIIGAEALLRWKHPERGILSPELFIDIAERNSVIFDLGKWIIEQACQDRSHWNNFGMDHITLTVNVSGRQFMDENFIEHLTETLSENELKPHQVGLEITERALVEEINIVQDIFKQLKRMNIKLSLDDFGTGYSSLSYLKRFPIDTIKIDRSFINDIPNNEDDCNLVKAILAIGHSLKMKIVAEGVETEAQYQALKSWGCESIQGFYFNHPMPEDIFLTHLLSKFRSSPVIPLNIKR